MKTQKDISGHEIDLLFGPAPKAAKDGSIFSIGSGRLVGAGLLAAAGANDPDQYQLARMDAHFYSGKLMDLSEKSLIASHAATDFVVWPDFDGVFHYHIPKPPPGI